MDEESLLETPLDEVEPYSLFKDTLLSEYQLEVIIQKFKDTKDLTTSIELQQEQPEVYQNLTKILNSDEQQIIQGVVVQADANAVARQATQAAATVNGNQLNGGAH